MNILYPVQNSFYYGVIPQPMKFNSITGLFRSEWLTDCVELCDTDELKVVPKCTISDRVTLFVIDEDGDMWVIGYLESLEHISQEMIMSREDYIQKVDIKEKIKIKEKIHRENLSMVNNLQLLKNADLEKNHLENVRLFNIVIPFFEYDTELSNEQHRFVNALTELVEAQHDLIEKTKNYFTEKE